MLPALAILWLAWSLSRICDGEFLGTGNYLGGLLEQRVAPALLPTFVFLIASAVSFATGTSWGTMGILVPLVVPLAWAVMSVNGMTEAGDMHILYSSVSCVLAGAVWGDHCSPISDTTVLSSLATGCDHMDHVRTQIPYALLGGIISALIGVLPAGFGLPWFILLPIAMITLVVVHRFLGKPVDSAHPG